MIEDYYDGIPPEIEAMTLEEIEEALTKSDEEIEEIVNRKKAELEKSNSNSDK